MSEGKDINVPSNDMISRQEAIGEAEAWIDTYTSGRGGQREREAIKHVISGIKKLPSAQPEIIRCNDCKHYNAGFECLIEGYGIERDKDWYCADAERETE